MYKLSVEFKSIEDLSSFVVKMGGHVPGATLDVAPATPSPLTNGQEQVAGPAITAPKATRSRAKKVEAASTPDVPVEEEMEEVESPFAEKPAPIPSLAPKVEAEMMPKVEPKAPAFNREAAITSATACVKSLQAAGYTGPEISPIANELTKAANGVLGKRMSEQTDEVLVKLVPAFEEKTRELVAAKQSSSFI